MKCEGPAVGEGPRGGAGQKSICCEGVGALFALKSSRNCVILFTMGDKRLIRDRICCNVVEKSEDPFSPRVLRRVSKESTPVLELLALQEGELS